MKKRFDRIYFLLLIIFFLCPSFLLAQNKNSVIDSIQLPAHANIRGGDVRLLENKVTLKSFGYIRHLSFSFSNSQEKQVTGIDLPVNICESNMEVIQKLKQQFHWVANIKKSPNEIIGEHTFRSPCIIQTLLNRTVVLIPDLNQIKANRSVAYYLDLGYSGDKIVLHYGVAEQEPVGHFCYQKTGKPFEIPAHFIMSFYLLDLPTSDPLIVLKKTNQFFWDHFGKKYTQDVRPQTLSFEQYADTGYSMALKHFWVDAGGNKGGITLSTYFNDSTNTFRGKDSYYDLWFQSWFNNMRTAYGLYAWGNKMNKDEWMKKSREITRLLLSVPVNKGWFPTIYNSIQNSWIPSGGHDGSEDYYMPDNTWTAYWLLRFDTELEATMGAKEFLLGFTRAFLKTQNEDGSFPSFIHASDLSADSMLDHSAGSAMGTWFLEEMMLRKEIPEEMKIECRESIRKSLNFLIKQILPHQRFEDFESFFSCSRKPMHYYDSSTAVYNQNTLTMQWCAEALLKGYELFQEETYLEKGEYCLNILSLYQQIWNPPFIGFYAFGGFGAQNTDAEWSDARQAQFADTYLQFYQATHNQEYLERAIAACRASFALMVIPENKEICPHNYKGVETNGESYSGSMAENYGHDGTDRRSFQSGFHWGTGCALTTAAIFKMELGDLYLDPKYHIAIGVNAVVIKSIRWGREIANVRIRRLMLIQTKNLDIKSAAGSRLRVIVGTEKLNN